MAKNRDVEQVAHALGISPQTVRFGLQQGAFPFGTAVKCEKGWSYILYPQSVKEVIGIELGRIEKGD